MLADSITALGFPVCFYYGFTGLACVVYYRHELFKSVRNFLLLGLVPLLGGLMLFGVFVKAVIFYGHAANVESAPIAGITLPLWFGIGGMILGIILMLISRPYFREFFSRKTETAPPGILDRAARRRCRRRSTSRPEGGRLPGTDTRARPPAEPGAQAAGASTASSCWPCGAPSSASRSRNGFGGNASGPSTPAPFHTPSSSSSSATTGLTAVCQTTAWLPYSRIVCSLSTTW